MNKYKAVSLSHGNDIVWLAHCNIEQIPCIFLIRRPGGFNLTWDYTSLRPGKSFSIPGHIDKYNQEIIDLHAKYSNNKSSLEISPGFVHIKNIELSKGAAFADELYDLAVNMFK